ncbi:MerR family transcriptional regulator [Pseudonocardia sp. ICBG601]|uniref:MerR family transcriptional regulator n=1 Tax=Pseudonocardia sp. ICBG601 TaxID=2846759 RepID=UPI001CF70538|nr:MerR family transcriptional regulator [Pseudonocardia sp. ICBG601]
MSESGQAQEMFTIGEVAERTGLSVHALRYYERENLLVSPVRRTADGRRTYTAADIEWLRYGVKLRESGMPLTDLAQLAALVRQGPGNENERLRILDAHLHRIEGQIEALEQSRALIQWKEAYSGPVK